MAARIRSGYYGERYEKAATAAKTVNAAKTAKLAKTARTKQNIAFAIFAVFASTALARNRARNVGDLLTRMAIVHAPIHPAHPLADRGVLDLEEVREIRRPHVEPLVGGAEQEPQFAIGQVRMTERRRVAIELLPVGLGQQRLDLLEHRRSRIGRQHLELRERRADIGGVVDRRRDRVPVVLQESEDVERGGDDAELAAVQHHLALVRLRNRTPPRLLQRRGIERFDAKAHRPETNRVESVEQLDVEPIEPRLGFEGEREPAPLNFVAQIEDALALLREQRVAEDHIRVRHLIAQPLDLVDDVLDRAGAVAGQNPVRA